MIFCIAILLISYNPISAAFDKHFMGNARYISLSGAYVGMADDETAVFVNPAGLIKLKSAGVSLTGGSMHSGLDMGGITRGNICVGMDFERLSPANTNIGVIGLGYDYFSVGTGDGDSYTETMFVLSFARKFSEGTGIGINLKIPHWSSDLAGNTSYEIPGFVMSIDIGLIVVEDKNLSIGGVVYDINQPDIYAKSGGPAGSIPFSSKFGLSYRTLKDFMTMNIDVFYQEDIIDVAAGFDLRMKDLMEGSIFKALSLRSGVYVHNIDDGFDFSFGAGYFIKMKNNRLHIDYAFKYPLINGISGTIGTHFLTTSYRFSPIKKKKAMILDIAPGSEKEPDELDELDEKDEEEEIESIEMELDIDEKDIEELE